MRVKTSLSALRNFKGYGNLEAKKHVSLGAVEDVELCHDLADIRAGHCQILFGDKIKQFLCALGFAVIGVDIDAYVHSTVKNGHVRPVMAETGAAENENPVGDKLSPPEKLFVN